MIYIFYYILRRIMHCIILEKQNKQKKQVESIFAPPSPYMPRNCVFRF